MPSPVFTMPQVFLLPQQKKAPQAQKLQGVQFGDWIS
jgi:hypothetical protein